MSLTSPSLTLLTLPTAAVQPTAEKKPILQLSPDLLGRIIEFLGPARHPRDLLTLRMTCKELYKIQEVFLEHVETNHRVLAVSLKSKCVNQASTVARWGIRADIAELIFGALRRGASLAEIEVDHKLQMSAPINNWIKKSFFAKERGFHDIVLGIDRWNRPYMSILGHPCQHKFGRMLPKFINKRIYTVYRYTSGGGPMWAIHTNFSRKTDLYADFYFEGDELRLLPRKIQSIMENAHLTTHFGYPTRLEMREIVRSVFDKPSVPTRASVRVAIAQIIVDYAAEPEDNLCPRCEIQQALGLGERIEEIDEPQYKQQHMALQAYKLIDEYAGFSPGQRHLR